MIFKDKYINPFTDFGFKKLFGTEVNKDVLIDFLNELLKGKEKIEALTYLNSESLGHRADDRKAIFDLYCENERGDKFIIEIQNVRQRFFKDRSIYYATFPIQEQASKGTWNYQLKAVYTIAIMDFTFEQKSDSPKLLHEVKLMDTGTNEVFHDKLIFIYLEMPNFDKQENALTSGFDKWLFILRNLPKLQERPKKLQEKIFKKLFDMAEIAKFNPEEKREYEASLKAYRDNENTMQYAIEEAVEKAVEKTKQEAKEETVVNLLKLGLLTDQQIAESTGLSVEQVNDIKSKI